MEWSERLINWYNGNKRDLPWRHTRDPYKIWLSEIILQQTRVEQGLPYFERLSAKYPDVAALAGAPEDELMKLWQGLGYYSRARNLQAGAKQVMQEYGGTFPQTYEEIKKLKGVGPYTAAAISSFSFEERKPVVDGNVFRVLSRYTGENTPIDASSARAVFERIAYELMGESQPSLFNQAIMEFGALYCKPVKPDCSHCIFNTSCFAYAHHAVEKYPVKLKKTKVRDRYFNYLHLEYGQHTYLQKRGPKDIWQNLYEFPLIESEKKLSFDELAEQAALHGFQLPAGSFSETEKSFRHQLTHQRIHADFWKIKLTTPFKSGIVLGIFEIRTCELGNYPVSRLVDKYLNL